MPSEQFTAPAPTGSFPRIGHPKKMSPDMAQLAGVVLLILVGLLDWRIQPQIGTSVFYLLPIVLVTWRGSRRAGLLMALACGITWLVVELITNDVYPNKVIPVWNALVRTTFFFLVSGLLAEVLERKRVEKSLRLAERRIAEATDREQRRIGEDLHDGVCQQLVGAAFAARRLAVRLAELSLPESTDAEEIVTLLGTSISQAREAARGLYLVELETDGLISALEDLAARTQSRHGILCEFIEHSSAPILEGTVVTSLFRIAQEAVNNAVKHARADRISIALSADPQDVRLEVEDNGVGLGKDMDGREGMGLHLMTSRAQMIGATLRMESGSDGGLRVICSLPRQKCAMQTNTVM